MTNLDYGGARITETGTTRQITYAPVKHTETRRGPCPACGKTKTRQATFEQTVSPFNRDPKTHEPRTPEQVAAALSAEADRWQPDFTCATHAAGPADRLKPTPVQRRHPREATEGKLMALARAVAFIATNELPLPGTLEVSAAMGRRVVTLPDGTRETVDPPPWRVGVTWVRSVRDLADWARALGVDTVKVRTSSGDATCIDVIADVDDITWNVHGLYEIKMGARDDVVWATKRNGKRESYGAMSVAALAALPEVDE